MYFTIVQMINISSNYQICIVISSVFGAIFKYNSLIQTSYESDKKSEQIK